MIEDKFVARKTSDDPIIYRVSFDDGTGFLEIGSISRRQRHTGHQDIYWRWASTPSQGNQDGEVWSLEQAFRLCSGQDVPALGMLDANLR